MTKIFDKLVYKEGILVIPFLVLTRLLIVCSRNKGNKHGNER